MALSAAEFTALVSTAPETVFEAFVVDLWDARGRELRRDGATFVLQTEPDRERTLSVVARAEKLTSETRESDVVVTATDASAIDAAGVDVVDIDDLYRMIRYAVDRDVADRLLATHFDYEPPASADSVEPESTVTDRDATPRTAGDPAAAAGPVPFPDAEPDGAPEPTRETARSDASTEGRSRRALLAAVGGGVLAGVGLSAAAQLVAGGDTETAAREQTVTPSRPSVTAPGVSATGVVDASALGAAHTDALEDVGYTLSTTRTVHDMEQRLRSSLSLEVALDSTRTYLTTVATAGPDAPVLLGSPPSQATYWSDGEVYLRAFSTDGETTYNSFRPPDGHASTWQYWVNTVPFGGQVGTATRYFSTLFGAVPTTLVDEATVDGTTVYRLRNTQSTPQRSTAELEAVLDLDAVRDIDLTAGVDDRGIVRSLGLAHVGDGPDPVTVRREITYTDIGDTSVGRPPWYDRALDG